VSEGSGVAVSVGAVVSVGDTAGVREGVAVAVAVGAEELQADAIGMTMMNNVMNLILGFISIP
jgi:hypothetical protein